MIRACGTGFKIGPLFADTPELADQMFRVLCDFTPAGAPIFLDVPEVNPQALALTEAHQMKKVFETARMYTRTIPDFNVGRVYGVTTFELG